MARRGSAPAPWRPRGGTKPARRHSAGGSPPSGWQNHTSGWHHTGAAACDRTPLPDDFVRG